MKIFQVKERYETAFGNHDAEYLLAAENESQAREAAEKKVRAKFTARENLPGGGVALTVVEIFDQERLERLEERTSLFAKQLGDDK